MKGQRSRQREVRRFKRTAEQRLEEAIFLFEKSQFYVTAVYLGGYAVECLLKALILCHEPDRFHEATLRSFRGVRAHSFDWLSEQVRRRRCTIPGEIAMQLARINWWTTDLRYQPGTIERRIAEAFLASVSQLMDWGKGRL